ncbi:MAG: glycosyltransferase family 87 protein [Steroidobacteraceae bacterium]
MTPIRLLVLLGCGAALLVMLTGVGAWCHWSQDYDSVIWVMLAEGPVYAAAVWLIGRHEALLGGAWRRKAMMLILGVAVFSRALLIVAPPLISSDIYRYVWDGRVQAAGINPYLYRPADPQVTFLRDGTIYPNINRAETAVTIYPPMAQLIFRAVTGVAESVTLMKLVMVLFEGVIVGALLVLLRSRGLPDTRIALYAWHPLPLFEFAGSGHIDAAAIGLMLLACMIAERRRPLIAGGILGAAALVKFFPLVILPSLYRRWDWRLPLGVAIVAIGLYLPFLDVGRQVLGYLPGYVQEERLATGEGFFVIEALRALVPLPGWATFAYVLAAVAAMGSIALAVVCRLPVEKSMTSALWLLAAFTLFVSPHWPWYFTWVLPFLCFRTSWALIYLSAISPLLYRFVWEPEPLVLHATLYLPFAVILLIEFALGPRRPTIGPLNDEGIAPRHAD